MSTLSQTIRKFNRFELKYLLTLKQAEQFKLALNAYLVPDEHCHSNGRYALASLYFDSPGLHCYHEKEFGVRYRRKLRIRRYENGDVLTEETPVFLEIKQRIDRVTQKRRAVLPYMAALQLCHDRRMPDCLPEDQAVIEEIYVFLWQYNLRPISIVRYDRQALVGTKYDIGLRVTFDTNLSFQVHPLHLHETLSSVPMLTPDLVVMEIKVNERIPLWLSELIAVHNFKMERVSKYCRSIEAAQDMPPLRRRNLPAENSEEVLATSLSYFSTLKEKMGIARH